MTAFAFCFFAILTGMAAVGMAWPTAWTRRRIADAWRRHQAMHHLWVADQARRDLAACADRAGRGGAA